MLEGGLAVESQLESLRFEPLKNRLCLCVSSFRVADVAHWIMRKMLLSIQTTGRDSTHSTVSRLNLF